jgi:hypothetical protein
VPEKNSLVFLEFFLKNGSAKPNAISKLVKPVLGKLNSF